MLVVWIRNDGRAVRIFLPFLDFLLHFIGDQIVLKLILQLHAGDVEDVLADHVDGIVNGVAADDHALGDVDVEAGVPQFVDARLPALFRVAGLKSPLSKLLLLFLCYLLWTSTFESSPLFNLELATLEVPGADVCRIVLDSIIVIGEDLEDAGLPSFGSLLPLAINGIDVNAWHSPHYVALFLQLLGVLVEIVDEVAEHIVLVACVQLFVFLQGEILVEVDVLVRYLRRLVLDPVALRLLRLLLFIDGVVY